MRKYNVGDLVTAKSYGSQVYTIDYAEPDDYNGSLVYRLDRPGREETWVREGEIQLAYIGNIASETLAWLEVHKSSIEPSMHEFLCKAVLRLVGEDNG